MYFQRIRGGPINTHILLSRSCTHTLLRYLSSCLTNILLQFKTKLLWRRYQENWENAYLPTVREGYVFTGICYSVHNGPRGYSVTAHPCYSAVGTHPTGMHSCLTVKNPRASTSWAKFRKKYLESAWPNPGPAIWARCIARTFDADAHWQYSLILQV